jgi:hypothetical protein
MANMGEYSISHSVSTETSIRIKSKASRIEVINIIMGMNHSDERRSAQVSFSLLYMEFI